MKIYKNIFTILMLLFISMAFNFKERELIDLFADSSFEGCIDRSDGSNIFSEKCFDDVDNYYGVLKLSDTEEFYYVKSKSKKVLYLVGVYNWYDSKYSFERLGENIHVYAYDMDGDILWHVYEMNGEIEMVNFYNEECTKSISKAHSDIVKGNKIMTWKLSDLDSITESARLYNYNYSEEIFNYFLKKRISQVLKGIE